MTEAPAVTAEEAPSTSKAPESSGTGAEAEAGSSSSGQEPSPNPDVELHDDEAACVANEVAAGVSEREATSYCVLLITMSQHLTDGLVRDFPGRYSEAELACIAESYATLDGDDLERLRVAALFGEGSADADTIVARMFDDCGTSPPEG